MIAHPSIATRLQLVAQPPATLRRPAISPRLLSLFGRYTRMFLRRHFSSIHLVGPPTGIASHSGPFVIYLNHASWWDPLICLILRERFTSHLNNFAPIDTQSLKKFRFFRKLGFFGVDKNSRRGARDFLQTSSELLSNPGTALWLTPQGDFVDPRVRPTELKRGIAYLTIFQPNVLFLPLALDYFFSGNRLPSAAAHFGTPLRSPDFVSDLLEDRAHQLAGALEAAQDSLAQQITSKRIFESTSLLSGRTDTGGIYGLWQSLRRSA
jgi:1-acyl-sn-glycerol-3-phosphate acyltransferase